MGLDRVLDQFEFGPKSQNIFESRRIDLRAQRRFLHDFFSGVNFDQSSFGKKLSGGLGRSTSLRILACRKKVTFFSREVPAPTRRW